MTRDQIIDLFLEKASKAGADAVRVKEGEQLNRFLTAIVGDSGSIFCPGITEIERSVALPADRHTDDCLSASICVEEVFGGIAETGSLICSSRGGRVVQAGLLPTHHVAIVSAENVHENLDDFFGACGDSPPTNITLETGPSRTADIELTLTLGVHGPERLSIIVV
jgi:L-lactate dehydrogenase complex protein LldG